MTDTFIRPAGSEFHANDEISGSQERPDVAALAGGGFVTVWENSPFDFDDVDLIRGVYARVHAPDGTPVSDDILVGPAQSFARASVDGLADGNFVVSWVRSNPVPDDPETDSRDIMARHFSADGVALDEEFVVAQQSVPLINDDGSRYVSEDHPHVAGLADGGFVISWQGNSEWDPDYQTGFGLGAYTNSVDARFYNADTTPRGESVRLNESEDFDQQYPEIVSLSDGNLVAVWDGPGDIDARIFEPDGTPVTGDFQVNTYTEDSQSFSVSGGDGSVAALNDGGFVVVWQSEEQDDDEDSDFNEWGVYGQRFANDGTPVGEEFRVNTTVAGNQEYPVVAATPDGGFMVAWYDTVGDDEIVAQLFDADGTRLGGELYVEELPDSITSGTHWRPTVDALENGDVALAWEFESSFTNPYERGDGIFGRVLDTSTTAFSDPELAGIVSPRTVDEGVQGDILTAQAVDADGDTVTYTLAGPDADALEIDPGTGTLTFAATPDFEAPADADANNVYEIEIIADDGFGATDSQQVEIVVADVNDPAEGDIAILGTPESGETLTVDISALSDPDGLAQVSYQWIRDGVAIPDAATESYTLQPADIGAVIGIRVSYADDAGRAEMVEQTVADPVLPRPASDGDDILFGGPLADFLDAGEGDDVIDAGDGNDAVLGRSGDDTLSGGAGDDNIAAAEGADVVNGDTGDDRMGGGPGNDTMDGGGGNDFMGGGQGNDAVDGGDGDDVVNGGPGDDTLDGGTGNDTMGGSFNNDVVNGGDGDDDMGGGAGQDTVDAGAGNDSVGGGEGNDEIAGGDGDDFLAGGGRDDVIDGGAGNDSINGGDGDDTMTGGDGEDLFVFNFFKDGDADIITDFEDGVDGFLIRTVSTLDGTPNIDNGGNGLGGFLDALNITDTGDGAQMTVDGHIVTIENVAAADLTLDDFQFI
ncbi:Ig-like domain-containing protein [Roseovarius sp. SYSU LYC5161]|uniref:Ig-like domain-containing protein n=1 Tax=Roseovarius halophilus (ex Wu et al. 2025) TaxID=3376060 RepID=UPI00399B6F3A